MITSTPELHLSQTGRIGIINYVGLTVSYILKQLDDINSNPSFIDVRCG